MNEHLIISCQRSDMDEDLIFDFLHYQARWSLGIPRDLVIKSLDNSLCFGAFIGGKQVGFARVVTDFSTFGILVDVFVVEALRGQGIARRLLEAVNQHPELVGLRRFTLATSDKQGLYAKFGFSSLARPEIFMEKHQPDIYNK